MPRTGGWGEAGISPSPGGRRRLRQGPSPHAPGELRSGAPCPEGRGPQGWNTHGAFPASAVLYQLQTVK